MKDWIIPIRSGLIILIALLAEHLIRQNSFNYLIDAMPYILGVVLAFIAIEYARLYKIAIPFSRTKGTAYKPLLWS